MRADFATGGKRLGRGRTRTVHNNLSGKVHATGSKIFRNLTNGAVRHGQEDELAVARKVCQRGIHKALAKPRGLASVLHRPTQEARLSQHRLLLQVTRKRAADLARPNKTDRCKNHYSAFGSKIKLSIKRVLPM